MAFGGLLGNLQSGQSGASATSEAKSGPIDTTQELGGDFVVGGSGGSSKSTGGANPNDAVKYIIGFVGGVAVAASLAGLRK